MRVITLNDYKRELAALSGDIPPETEDTNGSSEEIESIEGLEISEELVMSAENEVIVFDAAEGEQTKSDRDEGSSRRRRGRRGGRRGRGSDQGQG